MPTAIVLEAPANESPRVSWGAVVAGLATAVALQIFFAELSIGLGLAAFDPEEGDSAASVATGTLVVWILGALLAIFAGGWVAGRLMRPGRPGEAGLHGMLVWASGAVASVVVAGVSLGLMAGSTVSLMGHGMQAAATGLGSVAEAAAPVVAEAAPDWDSTRQQVQLAFDRADAAPGDPSVTENRFADRSRLMQLLGGAFTLDGAEQPAAERAELQRLLASQLAISPEAAGRTLDQWQGAWREKVAQFEARKTELANKAKEAAQVAKERAAQAALLATALMLMGLLTAVFGANLGARIWGERRARRAVEPVPAPT